MKKVYKVKIVAFVVVMGLIFNLMPDVWNILSFADGYVEYYDVETHTTYLCNDATRTAKIKKGATNVIPSLVRHGTTDCTIIEIQDSAFENCTNLGGDVNIPSSIRRIGNYAFKGCTAMNSVKGPPRLARKLFISVRVWSARACHRA